MKTQTPLIFLLALVAGILVCTTVHAQEEEDFAGVDFIEYEDFNQIVRITDIEEEFGVDLDKAPAFYNAATEHTWKKLVNNPEEEVPFVTCYNTTGMDASGNSLRTELNSLIGETGNIITMLNDQNFYCSIFVANPPTALVVGRTEGWMIQPLLPIFKVMKGAVADLQNLNDGGTSPVIDVELCPGVPPPESLTNEAGALADDNATGALNWWDDSSDSLGVPPSAERWFEVVSKVDSCIDIIESRIKFTPYPTSLGFRLVVTFDQEGPKIENTCLLVAFAAIMVSPSTCTIETRKPMKTANINAQWLMQTYAKDEKPFYDVGLTGRNMIVAVSDTGLDVHNCYFADPDVEAPLGFRNDDHRKIVEYLTENEDVTGYVDYEYG